MKKIVLCGGGTAGHIIPSLSLIPELKKYFSEIIYIGSKNGMEYELALKENLPFFHVDSIKFSRTKPFSNIRIPFCLPTYINDAKKILKAIKPDVIFSKGGYASLPVTLAAKQLKIPYAIHESDYSMGLANKLVSKHSACIMTNFKETSSAKNTVYTGIPLRESLFSNKDRSQIFKELDLPIRKTILVTGGSLGAENLNRNLMGCISELLKQYNVIHLIGKNNETNYTAKGYIQLPFTNKMGELYKIADIVVSRAGATTLSELECLCKRAILVPLSSKASRGDQVKNAMEYAKKEGFFVIFDDELTPNKLKENIDKLVNSKQKKPSVILTPNQKICSILFDLAK